VRVGILSSGGKDSAYSAWWAQMQGWEIVALITVGIKEKDSMMFQIPGTYISGFQSISMGVPWLPVKSNGVEEMEILELKESLQGKKDNYEVFNEIWPKNIVKPKEIIIYDGKIEIDALVTGALRSDYQKTRIEMMCEEIGVKSFSPLWHKKSLSHMKSILNHGFEIKFISVSCEGLDASWLGKSLTEDELDKLIHLSNKYRFNLDGEGGEFETITVNGPHMNKRIICDGHTEFSSGRGEWIINSVNI
tara:strand:+ start:1584 stop:2327 length:744 start_codon:yes stop_codon:yes gene_type:complete